MSEKIPQAFADAVCNVRNRSLIEAVSHDEGNKELQSLQRWHSGNRYRGIEGSNGVACDECRDRAVVIWADYERILAGRRG